MWDLAPPASEKKYWCPKCEKEKVDEKWMLCKSCSKKIAVRLGT